jgi:hypothetical protein
MFWDIGPTKIIWFYYIKSGNLGGESSKWGYLDLDYVGEIKKFLKSSFAFIDKKTSCDLWNWEFNVMLPLRRKPH